ncbi:flagellar protein FliT [Bowmanella dokdonensis]|uniref:Flagellar protein FliT n=1 Tax=Bowmanella dokdonensis TaxID=751969 RepID=A0A939DPF0_9ALTE|nr:flagellar protein FliT [Bowmanella dokdonensis]MBN7826357.1 hypothetical protein [Bowmanella dokdonensis]
MNKLDLNHAHSFPELLVNNEALTGLLCHEEPDTQELLRLVSERDELVMTHLASLEDSQKKAFIEAELACNRLIKERIQPLLASTEATLTSFVRSKKAIKKYKR